MDYGLHRIDWQVKRQGPTERKQVEARLWAIEVWSRKANPASARLGMTAD